VLSSSRLTYFWYLEILEIIAELCLPQCSRRNQTTQSNPAARWNDPDYTLPAKSHPFAARTPRPSCAPSAVYGQSRTQCPPRGVLPETPSWLLILLSSLSSSIHVEQDVSGDRPSNRIPPVIDTSIPDCLRAVAQLLEEFTEDYELGDKDVPGGEKMGLEYEDPNPAQVQSNVGRTGSREGCEGQEINDRQSRREPLLSAKERCDKGIWMGSVHQAKGLEVRVSKIHTFIGRMNRRHRV